MHTMTDMMALVWDKERTQEALDIWRDAYEEEKGFYRNCLDLSLSYDRGALIHHLRNTSFLCVSEEDERNHAREKRRIFIPSVVSSVAMEAMGKVSKRYSELRHGGSVANSYRYPAVTDAVLVVARYSQEENAVYYQVYATEIPANKVTYAGVANAFGYRDIADKRVSEIRRYAARDRLYQDLERQIALWKDSQKP